MVRGVRLNSYMLRLSGSLSDLRVRMKIDALKLDMTRYDFLPRYFDGRKRIIFMKNSVSPTGSSGAAALMLGREVLNGSGSALEFVHAAARRAAIRLQRTALKVRPPNLKSQ